MVDFLCGSSLNTKVASLFRGSCLFLVLLTQHSTCSFCTDALCSKLFRHYPGHFTQVFKFQHYFIKHSVPVYWICSVLWSLCHSVSFAFTLDFFFVCLLSIWRTLWLQVLDLRIIVEIVDFWLLYAPAVPHLAPLPFDRSVALFTGVQVSFKDKSLHSPCIISTQNFNAKHWMK